MLQGTYVAEHSFFKVTLHVEKLIKNLELGTPKNLSFSGFFGMSIS